MRDFGEILAENRKKKGYSQSDLVDLLSQEGIHYKSNLQMGDQCTRTSFTCFPDTLPVT